MPLNVEIKAKTDRPAEIRAILRSLNALEKGTDHQTDTYFHCSNGRMKLRQGNIENNLIFYRRGDQAGPKTASVFLHRTTPDPELKTLLSEALGIWKEVVKSREIFFIDNVKFHLDQVQGLGSFVEIEAIDTDNSIGEETLLKQCKHYMQLLGIEEHDLLTGSYSDMPVKG
ncbi:MAG: class IV adenylate cyclase [Bacteroidia bacterium]|nr:class IV adenylate cyclase [Bacteroidia bacterium]